MVSKFRIGLQVSIKSLRPGQEVLTGLVKIDPVPVELYTNTRTFGGPQATVLVNAIEIVIVVAVNRCPNSLNLGVNEPQFEEIGISNCGHDMAMNGTRAMQFHIEAESLSRVSYFHGTRNATILMCTAANVVSSVCYDEINVLFQHFILFLVLGFLL